MPTTATATSPTTPEWVNSKAATVGTWVADARKGNARNGPGEFRQVAEASTKGTTRVLVFTDGTARSFGVATKMFVAQAKPNQATPDPKPSTKGKAAAKLAAAPEVDPEAAYMRATELVDTTPAAAPSRLERLRLAKVEHAALQAWITDGENPPRPATPNLDAINAENTPTGRKVQPVTPKAAKAPRAAKAKPAAGDGADAGTRAPQGSYQDRVVAWVAANPSPEGVAPSAVDKGLGSRNASNALQAAAKAGKVTLVSEKPRRYSVVA